jgi:hypothetical protein
MGAGVGVTSAQADTSGSSLTGHARVVADSFAVYPADYDLIPYEDRDAWVLMVTDGRSWGWRITPGLGRAGGDMVLDCSGQRVFEQRGDEANRVRRWPLEEALAVALDIVDTKHAVMGMTAAQAIADRVRILASFEQR